MQIEFEIDQQRLTRTSDAYLIEGSKNFVECVFSFSSDWNELDKWALFKRDNNTYEIFIENNKCLVPIQCTSTEGEFTISVVGRKNAESVTGTASDKLLTVRGSEFVGGMGEEGRLTETYLVEVLAEVKDLREKTATSETNAAQSAKESADSAAASEASAQRAERAAAATETVNEQLDKVERLAGQVQANTNTTNAAAESARDDAEKAKAWAEGTLPGGVGTKSSKEWATDAKVSAGSAATSERNAADSENKATGKANTATLKAQEAESSAVAAQKSAETAGVKANEASISAGNALTSAKNAATSAANAAASEASAVANATKATEQAKLAADKAVDAANSAASSKSNADAAIEAKNTATLKAQEAETAQTIAEKEASKAQVSAATALEAVEWRYVAGVKFTPAEAAGTRLAAAENLTWEKSTDVSAGQDDFPAKFNCFNTYEALVKDGKVVATEGSYEFEKYKDDDEYDADVFVMFPKGYARRYYDGDGNEYRLVSDRRLSGYVPSPLHMVEGTEYDVVGITKYGWCDNGNGGLCSRANKPKLVNISWQTFESKSVARGAGIHAMSYMDATWLQHLGCIKYANRNWQSAVGNGVMNGYTEVATKKCTVSQTGAASIIVDNATAANFAAGDGIYLDGVSNLTGIRTRMILSIDDYDESNKKISVDGSEFNTTAGASGFYCAVNYSGGCDSVLGLDGEISGGVNGRKSVLTLGVENFYANDWKLLGNAMRVGKDVYINPKPLSAAAWPSSANDAIAKGWIRLGGVLAESNGYIKTLSYNANYPLVSVPASVGGTSSAPVGDYFYTDATTADLRILLLGGSFSSGANCGAFYVAVNTWLGAAGPRNGALGVFRPQ